METECCARRSGDDCEGVSGMSCDSSEEDEPDRSRGGAT